MERKKAKKVQTKRLKPKNIKRVAKKVEKKVEKKIVGTIARDIGGGVMKSTWEDNGGNPVFMRKLSKPKLLSELRAFRSHQLNRYLIGLIHPDLAVTSGLAPKLYHDVPIPTGTMGYRYVINTTVNASGNALLSFRPATPSFNLGTGTNFIPCCATINNDSTVTGIASNANNFLVPTGPVISLFFTKYRLVSQLIRVTYNDALLNVAGKFYACATYDRFSYMLNKTTNQDDPGVDRYGDFTIIQNGLWNRTVNIATNEQAIEMLWVPTDNREYQFEHNNTVYGTTYASGNTLYLPSTNGAHLNYVLAIAGAPANAKFIVEMFMNFELIADPTVAPYLNMNTDEVWDKKSHEAFSNTISKEMKGPGLIRTPAPTSNKNWFDTILDYGSKAFPLVSQILSLF